MSSRATARRATDAVLWRRCVRAVAPLHRRIFVWFGVAILCSGAVGFTVSWALGGGSSEWHKIFNGGRRVLAARFADVWDEPAARDAYADELAREMGVDVTVRDSAGEALYVAGDRPCARKEWSLSPQRGDQVLGRVDLCLVRSGNRPIGLLVGLVASLAVLWLIAHKVARHLGRPILELVDVTDAIGRGDYDVAMRPRRHAPSEIIHLSGAVREMAQRIKKQLADQRELLASVSHELRSPLARIRLLLELLRDDELSDERRLELLAELEHEVIEIDDLVGGLLAQSRLEFSAVSLRQSDLVEAVERAVKRASIAVTPEVTGAVRPVRFDATLVARALANLFDNAEKHGQGATELTVRFGDRAVEIEVHDRGAGLGSADAARIFDPFYGRAAGDHGSLGLGLSLVQRIARAHGGDAYAREREGGGATVGFTLPLTSPSGA